MRTLAALAAAALLAAAAHAQSREGEIILASGEPGRTYHDVYAVNLGALLRQFHVRYRETKGSRENLALLTEGQADLGFAQADLYAAGLREKPKEYGALTVIGRLGDECLFVAHRRDGPLARFADLAGEVEGRRPRIAVGPAEGGAAGTWHFLAALEPAYAGAAVDDTEGALAVNQLSLGLLDAVAWVTDPANAEHAMLRAVLAHDDLELLDVDDAALAYALPDGTAVYSIESVRVPDRSEPLKTLCTSALLLARPDAPPRVVEGVAELLSLRRDDLTRRH
jgi:uncharacterized protein